MLYIIVCFLHVIWLLQLLTFCAVFSGIGFALAERLLQHDASMHVCLGCRNKQRAEAAQASLLSKCPNASVSILLIDVAKPASVYQAAADLKQR